MKVIIFDLDGTLLNTMDDLYICFNRAVVKFGYPQRTKEEIRSFVGNGIKKAIERALPNDIEEKKFNKIVEYFKTDYLKHMSNHTKPYEDIEYTIKQLKGKGFKIAVLSNKYDEAVKELCKNYFGELIDIAIGESKYIRKKPETDGIFKIINELKADISKDFIIYAGDSEVDIQTAKNAKIPCISVLWGFKDKDFLQQNGGEIFAEKPDDIIKIIEKKLSLE